VKNCRKAMRKRAPGNLNETNMVQPRGPKRGYASRKTEVGGGPNRETNEVVPRGRTKLNGPKTKGVPGERPRKKSRITLDQGRRTRKKLRHRT